MDLRRIFEKPGFGAVKQKILSYSKSTLLVQRTSQISFRFEKPSLYLVFRATGML
jgi:hypothetical protein